MNLARVWLLAGSGWPLLGLPLPSSFMPSLSPSPIISEILPDSPRFCQTLLLPLSREVQRKHKHNLSNNLSVFADDVHSALRLYDSLRFFRPADEDASSASLRNKLLIELPTSVSNCLLFAESSGPGQQLALATPLNKQNPCHIGLRKQTRSSAASQVQWGDWEAMSNPVPLFTNAVFATLYTL